MTYLLKIMFLFILMVMVLPFESHACNSKKLPVKESSEEAMSVETYVVNGQSAGPGEFPYQVSLHPATSNATFCGGSIISPHLILTAAHCLDDWSPKYIKITAGLTDMSLLGRKGEQTRTTRFIYIHEKYDRKSQVNDIAVIELDSPLKYNEHVKNINLPKVNETFEGDVTVTGWGMTEQGNNQSYSDELKKVKLPIYENDRCKKFYKNSRFPVTENNICAGKKDSGSGMCQGDSGGPAICRRPGVLLGSNDNRGWVLCGIVSFGRKCEKSPGVCTRVASYIDWIEQAEKDFKAARQIVTEGIGIISANRNLGTPLHQAVLINNKAIAVNAIKLLIEMGVDVLAEDSEGFIFLHRLVDSGSNISPSHFEDMMEYLVSKNLSNLFNIRENNLWRTPLMLAAQNVELEMATILLLQENGVNVTRVDKNGSSYLSYAAEGNKNTNLLNDLSKNKIIKLKHTGLIRAIMDADAESVKVLVRLGANLSTTYDKNDEYDATLLHLAAGSRNKDFGINIIKFLIASGANVDANDWYGNTFLHRLIWVWYGAYPYRTINPAQFKDMATFLISKNLTRIFNARNNRGTTPVHLAVQQIEIEKATLSLLKTHGVDFNANDNDAKSPLYYATSGNRTLRLISDLVDLGANPQHLSVLNENMLHVAARNGGVHLLKFFDKWLYINWDNMRGSTPLHYAFYSPSKGNVFRTVQFLLKNGASSERKNEAGYSPREYFNSNRDKYPEADKIATCFSLGSSC